MEKDTREHVAYSVPKILKITVSNHTSRHMLLNQQNVILKTTQLLKLNVIPNWKTNHKVPLKLFHSVCLKRFFFPHPYCNLLISSCVLYIHDENVNYKEKKKRKCSVEIDVILLSLALVQQSNSF